MTDLDDIEELGAGTEQDTAPRVQVLSARVARRQRSPQQRGSSPAQEPSSASPQQGPEESRPPGTGSIWVKTFGCSHNVRSAPRILLLIAHTQEYSCVTHVSASSLPAPCACVCSDSEYMAGQLADYGYR